MVGSVLMQRMQQENDFALIEPVFFSTSNAGGKAPSMAKNETGVCCKKWSVRSVISLSGDK